MKKEMNMTGWLISKKSLNRILFYVFLALELYIFIAFLAIDIKQVGEYERSNQLKLAGIILCSIMVMAVYNARNRFPVIAMLFTLFVDIAILLYEQNEIGVFYFIFVQTLYLKYCLPKIKGILCCSIVGAFFINTALYVMNIAVNLLLFLSIIYFLLLISNVYLSIRRFITCKEKETAMFLCGFLFFFCCDINVGIFNLFRYVTLEQVWFYQLQRLSMASMWLFYLPSQVCLVSAIYFNTFNHNL